MPSLRDVANRFGEIFDEPKLPDLDYVEVYPRMFDLRSLTPQERQWLKEAQENDHE